VFARMIRGVPMRSRLARAGRGVTRRRETPAREFPGAAYGERPFVAARVTRPARGWAYAAAFASATLFSAKGIFAKKAYDAGASPETLLALRFGFALPVFAWIALSSAVGTRLSDLTRRDWGLITVLGAIGFVLSSLLDFHGLRYISVGLERMILYSYPAMVVLLTAWIARRRPGRLALAALALSYAGLALSFAGEASFTDRRALWIGGSLVFTAALLYAGFMIGAERIAGRIGSQRLSALGMVLCAAVYLPLSLAHGGGDLFRQRPEAYGWALLMAVFGTILPVSLFAFALKRIGASRLSVIGTAGAVAVLPLAALFLGEAAGPAQWGGFALTIAGGMVLTRR
jgi:drug/metabolite transporter (DMT)-like permease